MATEATVAGVTIRTASATQAPPPAHSARVDAYKLIADATRALGSDASRLAAWEQLVQGYAALRIATPVRRMIHGAALSSNAKHALVSHLTTSETRISWSRQAPVFDANLRALTARGGTDAATAEGIATAWRANVARLELYSGADGVMQVAQRDVPTPTPWLPALFPHHRVVDRGAVRQQWDGKIIRTLAVHGIGLGYAALDVVRASQHTLLQFSPLVALIEPSPLAWAIAFHLHDWREALAESRVRICAGSDAYLQFDSILADVDRHIPVLLRGGPAWPEEIPDGELGRRVTLAESARAARQARQFEQVCARDAECNGTYWHERFAAARNGSQKLRILGVTSRFTTVLQYAMRDWLAAFERAGHATHLVIEPDDHAHFSPLRTLDAVESTNPDLILLIDHLQHEYGELFPPGVPSVCWIQDNLPHLFRREAGRSVRPREFVIGNGLEECVGRFGYPAARFLPTRIPTEPTKLCDAAETPADLAPYACDVMFASNATTSFDERLARCRSRYTGDALRFFNAAFERLDADLRHAWFDGHYNFDALVAQTERALGLECRDPALRNDLTNELLYLADQRLREDTVRATARWATQTGRRFHLYGRGWDARPEFAPFARGPVAHGVELGRAFRGAAIALHVGCNSALHQRVLDGLCAGGFFLIRDKLADTEHALHAAIVRWYETNRPAAPFEFRAADLPPPFDDWIRRTRYWGGLDPDGPVTVRDSHVDWWYQQVQATAEQTPSAIWPDLPRVLYRNATELPERLEYFLAHADERREIAARMRDAVLRRFTYDALVREMMQFIERGLGARPE